MTVPAVKLNDGNHIPQLGYGVWQVGNDEAISAVSEALKVGYRHIDTAQAYENERGVGEGVRSCGIPREQLFITTKVWISNAGEEKAARSIDESLRKLCTDYVDLLLVHEPYGDCYGTYRAMEKAYQAGKARAIGLSNFYNVRFIDIAEHMDVKPAVLQLETHVFAQQKAMRALMKDYGTQLMAWGPLAQGRHGFFENETLKAIGAKYGKTNAQVALNWLVSQDIMPVPKTSHKERMASNLDIFDFELSSEDMEAIGRLDQGETLINDFNNDTDLAQMFLGLKPWS